MVFTTFYFSGTGNTKWAVEQFNHLVISKGHKGQIFSIDRMDELTDDKIKECLEHSDFIGFANPIYGGNIPPIMRKFLIRISNIQDYEKKKEIPVYIINTYAYVNAFGPIAAKKMFVDTYFYIQAYVNIRLCNNISKPKLKPEKLSKKKLQKRIDHAIRELNVLYEKLISDKKYITGIGAYLIPGILIRSKLKNAVLDNYKSLSVNNDTCLKCMQCVEHCPTKSIQYNEGKFVFLSDCTACMRCYNFCPTSSIMIGGNYADPDIYHRFKGPDTNRVL